MAFYVGQKVEYIGSPPESLSEVFYRCLHPYEDIIRKGIPYTVANVYAMPDGDTVLELVEVPAPETKHWCTGWLAVCFRPLVEKKIDISIFTAMLNTKQRELVASRKE